MNEAVFAPAPALSVIIPAYNASKTIAKTLLSLLDQMAEPGCCEIIVVDDGSNDDTLAVCTEFAQKHSNIHVIHQPNGGVSAARNRGLSLARGHWVSFVDSDDYVTDHYVDTLLRVYPEQAFVIFDNLLEQGQTRTNEKSWLHDCVNRVVPIDRALLWICENRINLPTDKRFSRAVIEQNRIRFENGVNMGEDLLFNFQYALCVDTVYVCGDSIYIHTENPEGLCHRPVSERRLREYECVYTRMQAACREHDLSRQLVKAIDVAFLRTVAKYGGQLYTSGLPASRIAALFGGSTMVTRLLAQPVLSPKDNIRKLLLKMHLYKICAQVLGGR